jgi:hypothetical protein
MKELATVLEGIDQTEHVPPDQLFQQIEALGVSIVDALPSIFGGIKNDLAEAEACKEQASLFEERARRAEARASMMKAMLVKILPGLNREKGTAGIFKYRIQQNGGKQALRLLESEATLIEKLPEFTKVKTTLDTDAIRDALADGATMPGVELLERGFQIRIS